MAAAHQAWVAGLLASLSHDDMQGAMHELGKVKESVSRAIAANPPEDDA
jgi:hypothetical protein